MTNQNPNSSTSNTQSAKIRAHLEAGKSLTAMEALDQFSCFRLASRINEINGPLFPIASIWVDVINAAGRRVKIKRYYLSRGAA